MAKPQHEIRDPIHGFIRLTTEERKVLDSRPLQRLRFIHQLAMAYLVYPGATHRRFEHSLGVMELAGRVFDVVTNEDNLHSDHAREVVREHKSQLNDWKRVVRLAALCHDIGHLPFSHAAEDLLPEGWDHERITDEMIRSDEMGPLWKAANVNPDHVAKVALGPKKFGPKKHRSVSFTPWERILSEIIVGDAFGVDRMDYLLRDSFHAGVAYGRFDHHRLIDTLRILPHPDNEDEALLGIEEGGVHAAEALLLARYFMYSQVYFHHVRRAYDFHLGEFLKAWLPNGRFSTNLSVHLSGSDNEVLSAIWKAADDPSQKARPHASRILQRRHFRRIYQRNPIDLAINPKAAIQVRQNLVDKFGADNVHYFIYLSKSNTLDFPVLLSDGKSVTSSVNLSVLANSTPPVSIELVYIAPERESEAKKHLVKNKDLIVRPPEGPSE